MRVSLGTAIVGCVALVIAFNQDAWIGGLAATVLVGVWLYTTWNFRGP